MSARGRVLIVAGSDSGGGAGIQADIKTVTVLGGYAATAVTAVTVQDTTGVHGVHPIPLDVIVAQMRVVLDDIGADAIKTGMLAQAEVVEAVADVIDDRAARTPLIVDPVMTAKGGASLLADAAADTVMRVLSPRAAVITPNAPEAARLTGRRVERLEDLVPAGEALVAAGARAALVKGGHIPGPVVRDVLVTAEGGASVFESPRLATRHTHGTGCTLASGVAAFLAQGHDLESAVGGARAYVREAIAAAPEFGAGAGPLDHGWPVRGVAGASDG